MGRINKYANIYNEAEELIRKVDEKSGKLEPYTIKELEELVDRLAQDKDENGNVKNPQALNNVNQVLFMMYQQHPEALTELLQKMKAETPQKTTEEQIQEAMQKLEEDLKVEDESKAENLEAAEEPKHEVEMDKYIDFEEVKEEAA